MAGGRRNAKLIRGLEISGTRSGQVVYGEFEFDGLLTLASEMDTEVKPSSKGRSRTMTAGKPHSYRRRRTESTASEDPRTAAWDMHRTT